MNPEKRRQFDSVDPAIEDEVPNPKEVKPEEFCKAYGPVFYREGRFSKKQPVPSLGSMDASKQEVEEFYDFWYNFDSWRSFEWHDKEVNEGTDSRDEKRFTEKKNKADRAKAKKEDITRVRELVDMVLANDPRIKRIKAEEKAARLKKSGAGGAAKALTPAQKLAEAKAKAEQEKQKIEEEKRLAEEQKVQSAASKKAREAASKKAKKNKKVCARPP
jgi:DnaJ homolog subfamily C member 2